MRARERQTFFRQVRETEEELQELARLEAQERQRIARLEAEEQERIEEMERQADALRSIAATILSYFGLEQHTDRFLASPDGLALLANCCNCAAKWYDGDLYEHKPMLINLATASGIECWQASGVVYIETAIGQVSFHALYGEDIGLPEANGRVWSGIPYQFSAKLVATAWLEHRDKHELEQAMKQEELEWLKQLAIEQEELERQALEQEEYDCRQVELALDDIAS